MHTFAVSRTTAVLLLFVIVSLTGTVAAAYEYSTPREIARQIESIASENKDIARLQRLGPTPGGRDILLLELGDAKATRPGILVIANMEANYPLAAEAAVRLSQRLVGDWRDLLDGATWYVVPLGNPDGYAHYFETPRYNNFGNDKAVNGDNDDAVDEDGPDDLNGDGYITMMRQVHPEGRWLPVENNPLLMKRADRGKGEIGIYRLFPEGIDNDGDGDINEDGPGGVNPGHNFPHNFSHFTSTDGLWAASEVESRAILRFAFDHPDIAMVIVLGRTNTLKEVPASNKRAEASQSKYKLPKWMARNLGIDPEQEFPLSELVEMARDFTGNQELTEEMVLQFLDAGAAVNPHREDLPYWTEISDRYKKFIEEAELDGKRLDPPDFASGSVEEWAYYQYGVPTFSMDFWTLPEPEKKEEKKDTLALTPEQVEGMTNDEFIALGADRIGEFLKASGAPAQFTAEMVINGLKGGMMDTKRMAKMMRNMQKEEESGGADATEDALLALKPDAFVAWSEYDHPTLGTVEIGGMIPYSTLTPPDTLVESLLEAQLPFIKELAGLLPRIGLDKIEMEQVAPGVWRIDAWIVNAGFLPYPTHQGQRCQRPTPAVVTVEADKTVTFLEGKPRLVLSLLAGSGGTQKVSWLVQGAAGKNITVRVSGSSIGSDAETLVLKGGGR